MEKVRPSHPFASPSLYLTGFLLVGLLLSSARLLTGEEKPQDASAPFSPFLPEVASGKPGAPVVFLTKKTRLWLGRNQVICFYARETPDEDRYMSFNADENFLHVLIPPTLAPGAHLGYSRPH